MSQLEKVTENDEDSISIKVPKNLKKKAPKNPNPNYKKV